MEYKQLVFLAPRWKEEFDATTNTMYLRAVTRGADNLCETLVDPIPGTDPVQYAYRCRPLECEGLCELQKTPVAGGVLCFCRCQGGPSAKAASRKKSGSKAKPGKKKPLKRARKA